MVAALKSPLENLFQSQAQRTTEETAHDRSVAARMKCLNVDPQLNPKPDAFKFHPFELDLQPKMCRCSV
jgi:hypothetical protein